MANLIHQRIVSLRERKNWTQADLAERAEIEPSYVSKLERGRAPNVAGIVLAKLASVLETSVDYLVNLTDDPNPRPITNHPALIDPRFRYLADMWSLYPEYVRDILHRLAANLEILNPDVRRIMRERGIEPPPLPDEISPAQRKMLDGE